MAVCNTPRRCADRVQTRHSCSCRITSAQHTRTHLHDDAQRVIVAVRQVEVDGRLARRLARVVEQLAVLSRRRAAEHVSAHARGGGRSFWWRSGVGP
jgi:hypothetical protein